MSRAALLPMPGDPFILNHFLSNFENVWKEEVDQLYILLNIDARMPRHIVDLARGLCQDRERVTTLFVNNMLFQGAALRYMLPTVKEDLLMSIEDDTVIVKKGQIDRCFRKIESGDADVVGSPRMVCSKQLADACARKWNLDYTGYGDRGPTYWPNFFFCRKSHLLKTDLHFEPKSWESGEYIEELDTTAEETLMGDVFTWFCIQLRAQGLCFHDVPQFHSRVTDLEDISEGRNLGDTNCAWIHIGSLTMTAEDLLMFVHDPKSYVASPKTAMEKQEYERRYAWLLVFLEEAANCKPALAALKESYINHMNEFIKTFTLSVKHIQDLMEVYRRFIQW